MATAQLREDHLYNGTSGMGRPTAPSGILGRGRLSFDLGPTGGISLLPPVNLPLSLVLLHDPLMGVGADSPSRCVRGAVLRQRAGAARRSETGQSAPPRPLRIGPT
jgi:hypothetical protein